MQMQRREGAPQRGVSGEGFRMREQQPERRGSIVVALVGIPSAEIDTAVSVFVDKGYIPFKVDNKRTAIARIEQGPDVGARRVSAAIKALEETRGPLKAVVQLDHPADVTWLQDKGAGVIGVTPSNEAPPPQIDPLTTLEEFRDRHKECLKLADVVVNDTRDFAQTLYEKIKSLEEQKN